MPRSTSSKRAAGSGQAFEHIRQQLEQYQVETKGVYIQDVVFPDDMVTVLNASRKSPTRK